MVAAAEKPLRYNGFGHAPTAIFRYAPKPEKMHRSVHTGKWGLCDCIHFLRLVERFALLMIQALCGLSFVSMCQTWDYTMIFPSRQIQKNVIQKEPVPLVKFWMFDS